MIFLPNEQYEQGRSPVQFDRHQGKKNLPLNSLFSAYVSIKVLQVIQIVHHGLFACSFAPEYENLGKLQLFTCHLNKEKFEI